MKIDNPIFDKILLVDSDLKASKMSVGIKSIILYLIVALSAASASFIPGTILLEIFVFTTIFAFFTIFLVLNNQRYALFLNIIFAFFMGLTLGCVACIIEKYVIGVSSSIVFANAVGFFIPLMIFTFSKNNLIGYRKFIFSAILGIVILQLLMFIYAWFKSEDSLSYVYGQGFWVLLLGSLVVLMSTALYIYNFELAANIIDDKMAKKNEWMLSFGIMFSVIAIYYQLFLIIKNLISYIFEKKEEL